jgi:hypothetical protein
MERVHELKARPCADCGVQYPPYIMDFDHVSGEKLDDICGMRLRIMEWAKIEAEAANATWSAPTATALAPTSGD